MRGLRPDRNPLRRRVDRIETFVFGGLLVAALTVAPLAAASASHQAYDSTLRAAQAQRLAGQHVTATITTTPASALDGYTISSMVPARARWELPNGQTRAGQIAVPAGSHLGQAIQIWTDASGTVTGPPLTRAQAADQGTFAAIMAIVVTLASCLALATITRVAANRRRLAAWAADWAVTAPRWNRQRW
jgi:hypothetical protein